MPKLFLRAVLTREEVADKQCLHAVQELFNVRAQPVIGTIVRPSTDKLQRPGGNHYETICQEGCNVLFARAVESPACGFPEEPALALSWGNVINHRSALSPQNRGLKLKLQAESSAGKQVHRHTKRKKKTHWRARKGGLFTFRQKEPECLWKPNEARNCFCMPWSDLH